MEDLQPISNAIEVVLKIMAEKSMPFPPTKINEIY